MRKLLAPLAPSQILEIGLNYRRHAEETKAKVPEFPVLFIKGLNALQNPGHPIFIPAHLPSQEIDYECELAVVIGRTCKNVSRDNALDYVLGVAPVLPPRTRLRPRNLATEGHRFQSCIELVVNR